MLCTLTVRDFVIVDNLELDFNNGFSVLTGETGAGKSILIDALQLAMGARGDSTVIRSGANKTDISASFSLNEASKQWLDEHEIDSDDQTVLLRRTLDANGRSKGYVNGVAVTSGQLREIGDLLVDVHGQHAHQALLKHGEQRLLLDRHAGLSETLKTLEQYYTQWQDACEKINIAKRDADRMQEDRERLQWQVQELEKLDVQEGEWEQVNADYDRLSHAAALQEGVGRAVSLLSEDDCAALSKIEQTQHSLSALTAYDASLQSSLDMLETSRIQIQEAVYELKDYALRVDLDDDRLHIVESRMQALYQASRQYHVLPNDLLKEYQARKEKLVQLEQAVDLELLQQQVDQAYANYLKLAQEVSARRKVAAKELSEKVTAIMQELHMAGGQLVVEVAPGDPHAYGLDQVTFLVSGHAGMPVRPLAKVASGGELARISLAISVIASKATETPTLIFDEVDTGVGGAVAEVVGQLLRKLGVEHQVLCVTHLPQVASQAMQHFQVSQSKTDQTSAPILHIMCLDENERIQEIARMLGGVEITRATLDHAKEMLKQE